MDALVCAQPDVTLVALSHRGDDKTARRNELHVEIVLQRLHTVDAHTVDAHHDIAIAGHGDGTAGAELLVAVDSFKWVDDFVDGALHDEDSVVVHAHPYVLLTVDAQAEDAVVQVGDVAACSHLVVVEVVAVETRQTVPGGYPDITVVVLFNVGYGVAAQTVGRAVV